MERLFLKNRRCTHFRFALLVADLVFRCPSLKGAKAQRKAVFKNVQLTVISTGLAVLREIFAFLIFRKGRRLLPQLYELNSRGLFVKVIGSRFGFKKECAKKFTECEIPHGYT